MAESVRHSKVVVFDAEARGWEIRESTDENSPPPHVNRRTPAFPKPVRCESPTLNLKRCKSTAVLHPNNPTNRPSNTSVEALHARIAQLESELEAVKTAYAIQNKLIDGFCKLKLRD